MAVIKIAKATAPSIPTPTTGNVSLFVDLSDSKLKIKLSDGTISNISGDEFKIKEASGGVSVISPKELIFPDGSLIDDGMGGVIVTSSGGGGDTFTNFNPIYVQIGGIEVGETFTAQTMTQMWNKLLYPYKIPSFLTFVMDSTPQLVEVGYQFSGSKTFTWSSQNSANIETNSISITNLHTSAVVGSSLANSGSHTASLPASTSNSYATHEWEIEATNTNSDTFTLKWGIKWAYRAYWGQSDNEDLSEAQIKGLQSTAIIENNIVDGSYATPAGGYKYFCIPAAVSPILNDGILGGSVTMATTHENSVYSNTLNGYTFQLKSITNEHGLLVLYRIYRTKEKIGAALTLKIN